MRDGGATSIAVVPADVDELIAFADRHGGSATDADVKRRYCLSVPDSAIIPWPPERNAACWCGTSRKYKKCCGRRVALAGVLGLFLIGLGGVTPP